MASVNPVVESEVVDPVCGMSILPSDAVGHATHRGQTYHFCSQSCLDKFRASPETYLSRKAAELQQHPHEDTREYTCLMDPEVRQIGPGACPKCGMALEPVSAAPLTKTEWTCPMHPEVVRDDPGSCPICGMALEPRVVTLQEQNPELDDMTRRFRWSLVLSAPILAFMVSEFLPGQPLQHALPPWAMTWSQFLLATPIVLWGGWPFFVRGWASVVNRHLNMFTLIALGVGGRTPSAWWRRWRRGSSPRRSAHTAIRSASTSSRRRSSSCSFYSVRSWNCGLAAAPVRQLRSSWA
jgi:Cu+-exporting ATPase